jgi:DNA invertase Pin-like site-specific DNA recombinase
MKRIAVYQRVSTDEQSTRMQQLAIQEWLTANEPTAALTQYVDEGISGRSARRPAFQKMCADVEAGKIDAVVVYRLDRLSRDASTSIRLLLNWIQDGIEFFPVSQKVLMLGKDVPFRLTIMAIFAELAQAESAIMSERIKAGLKAAKAAGKKLGSQRTLSDLTVETIRTLRSQGLSLRKIAAAVNVSHETVRQYI